MSFQSSLENVPGFEEYMQRYPQFAQSMHYRNSQYDRDIVVQFPGNVSIPFSNDSFPTCSILTLLFSIMATVGKSGKQRASHL